MRGKEELTPALTKESSIPSRRISGSAWGPTLLCCVTVSLLATGAANLGVIQTPRHLIKAQGGRSILKCIPMSGHNNVAWYQQPLGQGLKFLIQHFEKMEGEKGDMPNRFSVQQFSDYHSEMNMSALQLEDSAVYFCTSSPQPHRETGFLSLYHPVPAGAVIERGGNMLHSSCRGQECISSVLAPSACLSSQRALNTGVDAKTPDVFTCLPVPSRS
ncbi:T-cell receptor beta chain T17T-22 [Cricetulus griseus]|nr:T-cell receptor beta chain T17T-22 [Cricetulus griseus]